MEQAMDSQQLWSVIRQEINEQAGLEPVLLNYLTSRVLQHGSLGAAIADLLAAKLACTEVSRSTLKQLFDEALRHDGATVEAICRDLIAVRERDPAVTQYATGLLYFKGFQALQAYRLAHYFWKRERHNLALFMQSQISEVFTVDIHPAARIGSGILIDHATGIVIGETSVLDNDISILQGVTLGGTGKECGDRHPKVHSGVLIGAGAQILGNVVIGEGAKVGAGSVVLSDVPPHTTVAGVPAVAVGKPRGRRPALDMNHDLNLND